MNILNDSEHRIFLSAMSRERKICSNRDFWDEFGANKLLAICDSIEQKVNDAMPGPKNSICGVPLKEAMTVLTIYKYTNEREIGSSFVNGFEAGYKAAVDEMNKKLKESLDAVFKPMGGVKEVDE